MSTQYVYRCDACNTILKEPKRKLKDGPPKRTSVRVHVQAEVTGHTNDVWTHSVPKGRWEFCPKCAPPVVAAMESLMAALGPVPA